MFNKKQIIKLYVPKNQTSIILYYYDVKYRIKDDEFGGAEVYI